MRSLESRLALLCLALLSVLTVGCGFTATRNVRAFRAYANEDANVVVAIDRTEDLAEALRLVDEMLTRTPYKPGDTWPRKLALSDEQAKKIKEQLRARAPYDKGDHEVPVVKIYRVHLERVLGEAKAERASRAKSAEAEAAAEREAAAEEGSREEAPDGGAPPTAPDGGGAGPKEADANADAGAAPVAPALAEGEYPSLLAAMGELAPGAGKLTELWEELRRSEVKLAEAEAAYDKVYDEYIRTASQGSTAPVPPAVVEAREARDAAEDEEEKARKAVQVAVVALHNADLRDDRRKTMVRDALAASSVALRVDLESLALIPVVIVQAARSVTSAPKDIVESRNLEIVDRISELPTRGEQIEEQLQRQLALMQQLANSLSGLSGKDLADTAGFQMQESVVDQVVGVTLDSFRVNFKAGGDALFFAFGSSDNITETTTESSDGSSGTTTRTDYTGRRRRLEYAVDPVWLIGAKLNVGFDFLHLPNAANLNAGFATDRAFSGGGTIDTSSSLSQQLGVEGVASDIIDAGLGVLGVKSKVTLATFTSGEVSEIRVNPTNGADAGVRSVAPLQIQFTQIDVGYDLSFLFPEFAGRYYIEELSLAYKHMRYTLPRVLYELRDTNSSTKVQDYVYVRETPPQPVESLYHMGGFVIRMGQGSAPLVSVFGDLGLFFGGGPSAYYFLKTNAAGEEAPNTERNRLRDDTGAIAINGSATFGLRVRVTPKKYRLRLSLDAEYHGEMVGSSIITQAAEVENEVEITEGRKLEFGGLDFFHGPRFNLLASF